MMHCNMLSGTARARLAATMNPLIPHWFDEYLHKTVNYCRIAA
jgi:hypothetical protein